MATRGRPTQAQRLGLDVDLSEQPGGTWRAVVTDDEGVVLFDKDGYTSADNAKRGVGLWVRRTHGDQLAPSEKGVQMARRAKLDTAPQLFGHGLAVADLAAEMEMKADDQDATALGLRQQADRLEAEAKRLRAAADVLRGPDGEN